MRPNTQHATELLDPARSIIGTLPLAHLGAVVAGTLDNDPGMRAGADAFTGSKAGWYDLTSGLLQFDMYLPLSLGDEVDAAARSNGATGV